MALNRGSSMTAKCKGIKRMGPQRARMPWTEPREHFAHCILSRRDQAILDARPAAATSTNFGSPENFSLARNTMPEPLDALKSVVAQHEYNTSTGRTLFQVANHLQHNGRGLRFFRKEWREGTYDKHITLASVYFDRQGSTGQAYGYTTFHGESSLFPVEIDNANLPGWFCAEEEEDLRSNKNSKNSKNSSECQQRAIPEDEIVPPPPSIGTEVEVDAAQWRLRAYPFYDAPNPPEFVNRLLRERGVLPDDVAEAAAEEVVSGGGGGGASSGGEDDGSVHREPQ